jgi:hypothetical protein
MNAGYACSAAMEIAMKISGDLMRDSAVRHIVELCLTAKDTKTVRILFRAVQSPSIRGDLLGIIRRWEANRA